VTGPIVKVDTAALEVLARELAGLSDRLTGEGTTHEWQPPVPQPTGQATVDLTAAAKPTKSRRDPRHSDSRKRTNDASRQLTTCSKLARSSHSISAPPASWARIG
jgi:hypothetical protein